jgi:hypothetical protein
MELLSRLFRPPVTPEKARHKSLGAFFSQAPPLFSASSDSLHYIALHGEQRAGFAQVGQDQ